MNDTTDYRRYANRIRDAYTLTEAEGILTDLLSQAVDEARQQAFDKIFEMAPKENFEHWNSVMIANWFIELEKLEEQLTPKKAIN
jgi:hypothetical protein